VQILRRKHSSVNNDADLVSAVPGDTISMTAGDTLDIYNITAVASAELINSLHAAQLRYQLRASRELIGELMGETALKILYVLILGAFALGTWTANLTGRVITLEASDTEKTVDLKKMAENINTIKGWVEAQPKPKRRGD
jgi:hypothetical protein